MSSEIAIRARDISKHYVMFARPEDRLKQMVLPRLQRALGRPLTRYFKDFAALNGVSFEIRRGETIGIIGRNGSGKSTLLQIVCGTLQPTGGSIEVNGRIAALLELGAGFNPEFTGRENVYLNAAILGLSRSEIDARFDSIARFADIGDFIDQPVKTYSSGMYVRLAFATAINVDPDILVVDEALAVGDEAFQRKCFARIEQIKERGGTILFVSHSAQAIVQLCDRAILIDRGELILQGEPKPVTSQYQRLINLSGAEAASVRKAIKAMMHSAGASEEFPATAQVDRQPDGRTIALKSSSLEPAPSDEGYDPNLVSQSRVEYESHGARIGNVRIENGDGQRVNVLQLGHVYTVAYEVSFSAPARRVIFGFQAKNPSGLVLAGASNRDVTAAQIEAVAAGETYAVRFDFVCRYLPGTFLMDVGVFAIQGDEIRFLHRILDAAMFRVAPETDLFDQGLFSLNAGLTARPIHSDMLAGAAQTTLTKK